MICHGGPRNSIAQTETDAHRSSAQVRAGEDAISLVDTLRRFGAGRFGLASCQLTFLSHSDEAQSAALKGMLMIKVCWDDIDRSSHSGTYFVRGSNVTVRDRDIEVWRDHPEAVFDTVWYRHPEEADGSHRLISWEVSLN